MPMVAAVVPMAAGVAPSSSRGPLAPRTGLAQGLPGARLAVGPEARAEAAQAGEGRVADLVGLVPALCLALVAPGRSEDRQRSQGLELRRWLRRERIW